MAGVAAAGGRTAIDALWSGPEALPSEAEMADPAAWVRRVVSSGTSTGVASADN
ncbi:MAG: zinc-dependent metalloprotease [Candidatus Limnocylindrales bacterium]